MELKDTIKLMSSEDYKERFAAEYLQTRIRYQKLHRMIIEYEAKKLKFTPTCGIELLKEQKRRMGEYLNTLEVRALVEEIDLEKYDKGKKGEQIVYAGEVLIKHGERMKVVCADADTFVVAPKVSENGHETVRYDLMEAYENDPSVSTLALMEFEKLEVINIS